MKKYNETIAETFAGLTEELKEFRNTYPNVEAFNIATDIAVEYQLPENERSNNSFAEKFSVDPSQSVEELYVQIAAKLDDPSFKY